MLDFEEFSTARPILERQEKTGGGTNSKNSGHLKESCNQDLMALTK
jgi:hypothetical protein